VVAKQMVDEEQRPRERPAGPSVNRTLEEKAGAGDHPEELEVKLTLVAIGPFLIAS
jgi:hypothetical protein